MLFSFPFSASPTSPTKPPSRTQPSLRSFLVPFRRRRRLTPNEGKTRFLRPPSLMLATIRPQAFFLESQPFHDISARCYETFGKGCFPNGYRSRSPFFMNLAAFSARPCCFTSSLPPPDRAPPLFFLTKLGRPKNTLPPPTRGPATGSVAPQPLASSFLLFFPFWGTRREAAFFFLYFDLAATPPPPPPPQPNPPTKTPKKTPKKKHTPPPPQPHPPTQTPTFLRGCPRTGAAAFPASPFPYER